jgi:hypothetical protein
VNCQHSFPWVHGVHDKFGKQGFDVISIHTPEFDWEKERTNVKRVAEKFGLKHPIYLDNDNAYWDALGNTYWPAFYLVDKKGRVRMRSVGEMISGETESQAMEEAIALLLLEG